MCREIICGSGLFEVVYNNDFSIIATGAVINASHEKQSRFCLQVATSTIYTINSRC